MTHRDFLRRAQRGLLLGLLPLVLFPGAGSELYRGLGSVMLGGLLVSTIFTLVLVPVLFSLALEGKQALSRRLGPGRVAGPAPAGLKPGAPHPEGVVVG